MEVVLALDPGVTTGYCYGVGEDNVLYLAPGEHKFTMVEFYELLEAFIGMHDHTNLIYEDFTYRNYARMGLDLTPVKIIGIIELFVERYEPLLMPTKQSASTGKSFYNDDELKRLGVYKVGKKHGRDATRHLLQWANFGGGGRYFNLAEMRLRMVEEEEILGLVGG